MSILGRAAIVLLALAGAAVIAIAMLLKSRPEGLP
jgi:hypothetical protein